MNRETAPTRKSMYIGHNAKAQMITTAIKLPSTVIVLFLLNKYVSPTIVKYTTKPNNSSSCGVSWIPVFSMLLIGDDVVVVVEFTPVLIEIWLVGLGTMIITFGR